MSGDKLEDYPCPWATHTYVVCQEICDLECNLRPFYRRHIALRRAVLGDMTAEEAAQVYRNAASGEYWPWSLGADRHLYALADVVEGMEVERETAAADLTPLTAAMIGDIDALPILADGGVLVHHTETNQSWIACGPHVSVFMFEVMQRYGLIVKKEPEVCCACAPPPHIDVYAISDAGRAALARQESDETGS